MLKLNQTELDAMERQREGIYESVWSALYSAQSYPFEMPTKGKIAVKVINHYGDEVLKVYEVN